MKVCMVFEVNDITHRGFYWPRVYASVEKAREALSIIHKDDKIQWTSDADATIMGGTRYSLQETELIGYVNEP